MALFEILIQISPARQQESQEAHLTIVASLLDAKQHKIVADAVFGDTSVGDHSILHEVFYGVLCIIVIPRHTVIVQEEKQFLSILREAFLILPADRGLVLMPL